jgi:protein transport protein SEC13
VFIWEHSSEGWKRIASLKEGGFGQVVWRTSWSLSGNVLAVSSGDNVVSLWKENLKGEWECVNEMDEKSMYASP